MAKSKQYSHLDTPEVTLEELISLHMTPDHAPRFDREVASSQQATAHKPPPSPKK